MKHRTLIMKLSTFDIKLESKLKYGEKKNLEVFEIFYFKQRIT